MLNDIDIEESKRLAQEIINNPKKKNFKYKKNPKDIIYIRGNTTQPVSQCPNCGKTFPKNNGRQIVYFCSRACRKSYREVPTKFVEIK